GTPSAAPRGTWGAGGGPAGCCVTGDWITGAAVSVKALAAASRASTSGNPATVAGSAAGAVGAWTGGVASPVTADG
ncbi:MAG: hypothetical protein ACXVRH_11230, partial [Thermoleophilaceae bacterium]